MSIPFLRVRPRFPSRQLTIFFLQLESIICVPRVDAVDPVAHIYFLWLDETVRSFHNSIRIISMDLTMRTNPLYNLLELFDGIFIFVRLGMAQTIIDAEYVTFQNDVKIQHEDANGRNPTKEVHANREQHNGNPDVPDGGL